MNRRTKINQFVSLLLALILLLTVLPAEAFAVSEPVWQVDGDCLTVSGDIPDYATFHDDAIPWKNERWHITKLVVEEGVTQIGDYAFHWMPKLTEVSLPSTLKRVGEQAMSSVEILQQLELPESVEEIGDGAFQGNSPSLTLTVLNRACRFGYHPFGFHWSNEESKEILDEQAVLRGYTGSTAETYAGETGVKFSPIDQEGWNPAWNIQMERVEDGPRKDSLGRVHLSTLEDLLTIRDDLGGSYILDNDIHIGSGWEMPYGAFTGILDGNGHSLTGLTLSEQIESGFFQELTGIVCDISFTDVNISTSASNPRVGIVAAKGGGQIVNCSVSGSINVDASGWAMVGGITGGSGALSNCVSDLGITVAVTDGCSVGAFTAEAAQQLSGSRSEGSMTVRQSGSNSGAQFNVYGIWGASMDAAVDCTNNMAADVDLTNGRGYVFGMINASGSENTGQIDVYSESGTASAVGGQNVRNCENRGEIYAFAMGSGSSTAIGLAEAIASANSRAVIAQANGQASAYACGISGAAQGNAEESEDSVLTNSGAVSANTENGEASAIGVTGAASGGFNTGSVTAESGAHKAVAMGMSNSAYGENNGTVSAVCNAGSTQTALACGLSDCTDSYNRAPVSANHTGTGQSLARGCSDSTRCVNEGAVNAEGVRSAGASGLDGCTDSSNSGNIYALSTETDGKLSPTVYSFGWRNGTNCVSAGTAEAEGRAFTLQQGDREGWSWNTAVDAGNSAEVKASVAGFYSVACTPGNPVPVYMLIIDGAYQGVVMEKPADVPEHTQYLHVKTFSADGNTTLPERPRENSTELQPNLSILDFTFHRSQGDDKLISTIGINCGSLSFDTGLEATPYDPISTDYRHLYLRILLKNTGSAASQASQMSLTLPDGFSFAPDVIQSESTIALPSVPANSAGYAWAVVYPLYSETYRSGDLLYCDFTAPSGLKYNRAITGCQVYMPQKVAHIAQVYYGESALYPGTLLFKYYEWKAADFLESSDRYHESIMRLSALLSQAVYLYQDGDIELANGMMSALGLSLVSMQGENTIMGSKNLYAKKTFVVEGEVYELFITSILGATDVQSWLGTLAFISKDKYHAGFHSVAQKAKSNFDAYREQYAMGGYTKYLIIGHSRGGASANLLGAMLDHDSSFDRNNIFCYTFAAPNGVLDKGELTGPDYKNIFNIINFNDVVGYIPGCYSKYGVTMVYECEADTVSSLYIAPIREFSTDELLLGNASALRLQITLAFLLPQIERVITKHLMPYYIEDVWALNLDIDKPLSMEGANLRQDDICRKYMDGVITGGDIAQSILNVLGKYGWKAVMNLAKPTKRQSAFLYFLLRTRDEVMDKAQDMAQDKVFHFIVDDTGRDLIRKGIMHLRCPIDIDVYDSNNNLALSIKNDRIARVDDNLMVLIDGSHKMIYFPLDGQYRFEITGYSDGSMDVQYYETDDQGTLAKIESYQRIPVQNGASSATIRPSAGGANLYTTSGELLEPQSVSVGDELNPCAVSSASADDVQVFGCGSYYRGEYTYLTSIYTGETPAEFQGWYVNGELVGTEVLLSVPVEGNMSVEARYAPGEAPVVTPGIVSVIHASTGVSVTLQGLTDGAILAVAAYNTNDRMTGCAVRNLTPNATREIISLPEAASAASIQVFLLESGTYRPLCEKRIT